MGKHGIVNSRVVADGVVYVYDIYNDGRKMGDIFGILTRNVNFLCVVRSKSLWCLEMKLVVASPLGFPLRVAQCYKYDSFAAKGFRNDGMRK